MSARSLSITHHRGAPAAPAAGRPEAAARPDDLSTTSDPQPVFWYDLGSPESYLAAERVNATLPVIPEWVPVLAAGLPGCDPVPLGQRRAAVERRAVSQHVQPLRWPDGWPHDTRKAMLAATYAKQIGRGVAFSLAAFRQAFAGGRALDEDTILIAAAACEMHPRAVLQALGRSAVAAALDEATARAARLGVLSLPAVTVGEVALCGDDAVERAAALLAEREARA